jgi:hypothetical protein
MSFAKRSAALFCVGAVMGSLGDLFHVLSGTEGYPPDVGPFLPGGVQPYWVPLLFGGATVTIGLSHPLADRALGPGTPRRGTESWNRVAAGNVLVLAAWAASGFLPLATGGAKDLLLAATAAAVWWALDRTWQGLALGAGTAAIGTVIEASLVARGAFFYYPHATNFFGVASWLPWLYVTASVAVGNLGRKMAFQGQ